MPTQAVIIRFIQNMNHGREPTMVQVSAVPPYVSESLKAVVLTDFQGMKNVSR